jgi:glucose-1-phosphate thymidylyltransferase
MKGIILAAGYATRLYPLTKDKSKPLLAVKGEPIIDYILRKIEGIADLDRVYVVTNNKFYNDYVEWSASSPFSKEIVIVNDNTLEDETKLGAIGDIDYVLKSQNIDDDILIIAGDNLFNFNIESFIKKGYNVKPSASMGVYDIKDIKTASLYGIVALDEKGLIVEFQEKPDNPKSTLAAVGIYFLPKNIARSITNYLSEGNSSDQPGHFMTWLSKQGKLYGFELTGDWYDIGSIESYNKANESYKEG